MLGFLLLPMYVGGVSVIWGSIVGVAVAGRFYVLLVRFDGGRGFCGCGFCGRGCGCGCGSGCGCYLCVVCVGYFRGLAPCYLGGVPCVTIMFGWALLSLFWALAPVIFGDLAPHYLGAVPPISLGPCSPLCLGALRPIILAGLAPRDLLFLLWLGLSPLLLGPCSP